MTIALFECALYLSCEVANNVMLNSVYEKCFLNKKQIILIANWAQKYFQEMIDYIHNLWPATNRLETLSIPGFS